MPETTTRMVVRRIVTAIPASVEVGPLLRLAARMAGECDADVAAVLVHSEALLRLASLPVTRHLLAATGAAEPLTAQTLRLAMAASGQRVRQDLESILGASHVRWTLQILADESGGTPPVQMRPEDLLLISAEARIETWFRSGISSDLAVAAFAVKGEGDGAPDVVAVHDGTDAGWRAFEAAVLLARAQSGCCHVIVPAGLPADTRRQIDNELAGAGLPCRAVPVEAADPASIAAIVRDSNAGIVVLPAGVLRQSGLAAALRRLAAGREHGH